MQNISRRDFLKSTILFFTALYGGRNFVFSQDKFDIVEAQGENIKLLIKEALKHFGGLSKFVKPKSKVIIKPNISWSMFPEEAVNTNPEVLRYIIEEVEKCKADKILVLDHTIRLPGIAFAKNGAQDAVKDTTAHLKAINSPSDYTKVHLTQGKVLKTVDLSKEISDADIIINVPVAKVHGSAGVTFSMKNLMGLIWDRGYFHRTDLTNTIVDLAEHLKPKLKLTILDAVRILTTNGPGGHGKVEIKNKIIVGVDFVAVDAYGCTLFNLSPENIPHMKEAHRRNLGKTELSEIVVKKINV